MDWSSFSVWGMISCVHFLCCDTFPWSISPSHTECCQKAKLSMSRRNERFQHFHVKALPQLWELCVWLLLWWIDKGRTVTSLNYFSHHSQNLAGDSKCRRQSSLLQSLACFCSLTADSLKSEASPVKRLKFCLFIL